MGKGVDPLRAKGGVQLILHLGARPRDASLAIEDPAALLVWLATAQR